MPTPEVFFLQFRSYFAKLFKSNAALGISLEIAVKLNQIKHTTFTPNEIQFAAGQIKPGKLSALATFCIEYLFNHKDGNL